MCLLFREWSLPSLGAWIEIRDVLQRCSTSVRRSLHWERGLKSAIPPSNNQYIGSLPSLGAWIEITFFLFSSVAIVSSLPSLGAWIEISPMFRVSSSIDCRSLHWERGLKYFVSGVFIVFRQSLPSLGAWIEIAIFALISSRALAVAPFIGSVD